MRFRTAVCIFAGLLCALVAGAWAQAPPAEETESGKSYHVLSLQVRTQPGALISPLYFTTRLEQFDAGETWSRLAEAGYQVVAFPMSAELAERPQQLAALAQQCALNQLSVLASFSVKGNQLIEAGADQALKASLLESLTTQLAALRSAGVPVRAIELTVEPPDFLTKLLTSQASELQAVEDFAAAFHRLVANNLPGAEFVLQVGKGWAALEQFRRAVVFGALPPDFLGAHLASLAELPTELPLTQATSGTSASALPVLVEVDETAGDQTSWLQDLIVTSRLGLAGVVHNWSSDLAGRSASLQLLRDWLHYSGAPLVPAADLPEGIWLTGSREGAVLASIAHTTEEATVKAVLPASRGFYLSTALVLDEAGQPAAFPIEVGRTLLAKPGQVSWQSALAPGQTALVRTVNLPSASYAVLGELLEAISQAAAESSTVKTSMASELKAVRTRLGVALTGEGSLTNSTFATLARDGLTELGALRLQLDRRSEDLSAGLEARLVTALEESERQLSLLSYAARGLKLTAKPSAEEPGKLLLTLTNSGEATLFDPILEVAPEVGAANFTSAPRIESIKPGQSLTFTITVTPPADYSATRLPVKALLTYYDRMAVVTCVLEGQALVAPR